MRKLLNTLYITSEDVYLSLDGENIVMLRDGNEAFRMPFSNLEGIVCFSYLGCSPALMGKCADNGVSLCFMTPTGRFLARVTGKIKGNVFLRKQQIKVFDDSIKSIELIKKLIFTKLKNTKNLIGRTIRDFPKSDEDDKLSNCQSQLLTGIDSISSTDDIEVLRGIEGNCAKTYFDVFNNLIIQQKDDFIMYNRSKRPPLDRINAILSFLYTVCTNDIAAALETVGLDPYIGFFHTLRPGRVSLACDIMEEFRCIVERFTLTLINLKVINKNDFEEQVSGAVLLNDDGRKKVITAWQEKKREVIMHKVVKEKIQLGLFPYVQANLLAKYIRGETDSYENLVVD